MLQFWIIVVTSATTWTNDHNSSESLIPLVMEEKEGTPIVSPNIVSA